MYIDLLVFMTNTLVMYSAALLIGETRARGYLKTLKLLYITIGINLLVTFKLISDILFCL